MTKKTGRNLDLDKEVDDIDDKRDNQQYLMQKNKSKLIIFSNCFNLLCQINKQQKGKKSNKKKI